MEEKLVMIRLSNIHKQFGQKTVLASIDLLVKQGEVVSLIGPSGTGKTTLLRSINLLERPDRGTVQIDEVKVTEATHSKKDVLALRRKTAMVFQQYNLFRNLKVIDNVSQPQIVVRGIDKHAARKRSLQLLNDVGLAQFYDYYPSQLSGGQQQRVSIARALALNPKVILFDEPTSALDPELSREVLNVIKKVANSGISILLATHEMQFAEDISDNVVFMEHGKIIEQNKPEIIFHHPTQPRTREFLQNYQQNTSNKDVELKERLQVI